MGTIGCDPEFLVRKTSTKGFVPSVGMIGGSKEEPVPIKDMDKGFMVHEDNVLVEIGIPPAKDEFTFANYVGDAIHGASQMLPRGHSLSLQKDSHQFTAAQLNSKQAQEIGCEQDNDAYEQGANRTQFPSLGNDRYAGGHIHLGGKFNCPPFVAALICDVKISLPLIAAWSDGKESPRAQWYGRPGIFREKPYGIEYRTPSNRWCMTNDSRIHAGRLALHTINYMETASADLIRSQLRGIDWETTREAIIKNNAELAYKAMKNNKKGFKL